MRINTTITIFIFFNLISISYGSEHPCSKELDSFLSKHQIASKGIDTNGGTSTLYEAGDKLVIFEARDQRNKNLPTLHFSEGKDPVQNLTLIFDSNCKVQRISYGENFNYKYLDYKSCTNTFEKEAELCKEYDLKHLQNHTPSYQVEPAPADENMATQAL